MLLTAWSTFSGCVSVCIRTFELMLILGEFLDELEVVCHCLLSRAEEE